MDCIEPMLLHLPENLVPDRQDQNHIPEVLKVHRSDRHRIISHLHHSSQERRKNDDFIARDYMHRHHGTDHRFRRNRGYDNLGIPGFVSNPVALLYL